MPEIPEKYLSVWGLSDPAFMTETPRCVLYSVNYRDNRSVLKIFKSLGIEHEQKGAEFLKLCPSDLAVSVLENDDGAVLLEYIGGPDLRSWVEEGRDDEATRLIATLANRIHALPVPDPVPDFPDLQRWFAALFSRAEDEFFDSVAALAKDLLSDSGQQVLLHGDIHHENILFDESGTPKIIDPKGLLGDPAYDVANAMCNPHIKGLVTKERIMRQSSIFSEVMGIDRKRILAFAKVHAGVSYAWCLDDGEDPGDSLEVARMFYEIEV